MISSGMEWAKVSHCQLDALPVWMVVHISILRCKEASAGTVKVAKLSMLNYSFICLWEGVQHPLQTATLPTLKQTLNGSWLWDEQDDIWDISVGGGGIRLGQVHGAGAVLEAAITLTCNFLFTVSWCFLLTTLLKGVRCIAGYVISRRAYILWKYIYIYLQLLHV